MKQTTAVTGLGIISPLGRNTEEYWQALLAGRYGIGPITLFDTADYKFTEAGEVKDWSLPKRDRERVGGNVDRATEFLAGAASEALENAGLADPQLARDAGIVAGSNFGGIASGQALIEETAGFPECPADTFARASFSSAADTVAALHRLGGPRITLSLSCSSGNAAITVAADLITSGRATIVLAGGYDALSEYAWSGLSALRTMTRGRIRPFDKDRDGTIFSEGAAVLVLESAESARRRGAEVLAVVAGAATNNNAFHMTAPAKQGAGSAAVMKQALENAAVAPRDVDHINAHGTGTQPNDVTETQAIKNVFGEHAYRIPVTSIKSMTGHLMGAAGSAEAIASILAIRGGIMPPTINYRTPDPECDLDYVVNEKRSADLEVVLSNSAGIGGCNAAVVFRTPAGGDNA